MEVIKRDNSKQKFDFKKIEKAVNAAFQSVNDINELEVETVVLDCIQQILNSPELEESITVEEIQDIVEEVLMANAPHTAKAFVLYREQHALVRSLQERIDYMDQYSGSTDNAATASETDGNANVTLKNVANLDGEVYKTTNRLIQRMRMKKQLQQDFPEVADLYATDIEHHTIYIHDEASTPTVKNYCEAVSLYPLAINGTSTMDAIKGEKPPQNLNAFCGQLVNLSFLLASQCKGAVAFGEFFNFFDYYCAKDYGYDYPLHADDYADSTFVIKRKTIGEKIDQAFQQIVYG